MKLRIFVLALIFILMSTVTTYGACDMEWLVKKTYIPENQTKSKIQSACSIEPTSTLARLKEIRTVVYGELSERKYVSSKELAIAFRNQTACGHPTLKDGVCFGPHARLAGIQKSWSLRCQNPLGPHN